MQSVKNSSKDYLKIPFYRIRFNDVCYDIFFTKNIFNRFNITSGTLKTTSIFLTARK